MSLTEIIQEAADFARSGSSVKSRFEIQEGLWAANADKAKKTSKAADKRRACQRTIRV